MVADARTRFQTTIPADRVNDKTIRGLSSQMWKLALWSLYVSTGQGVPNEAKRASGAIYGFCDVSGTQRPRAEASHFGWTLQT